MLPRSIITSALVGCGPAVANLDNNAQPRVIAAHEIFVIDRDDHMLCLSDCLTADPDPDAAYENVRSQGGTMCALRTDGQVECWGPRDFSELVPKGVFLDVALSSLIACALDEVGEVQCWGLDSEAAAEVERGAPPGPWVEIQGDGFTPLFCVADAGGRGACWDKLGTTPFPQAYASFKVRGTRACGLSPGVRTDGFDVDCFTRNATYSAPATWVKEMGLAQYFECVLLVETSRYKEGTLRCSGDKEFPQGQFEQLSVDAGQACVLTDEGEVICWGGRMDQIMSYGTF